MNNGASSLYKAIGPGVKSKEWRKIFNLDFPAYPVSIPNSLAKQIRIDMPNTKSAERRVRNSSRKNLQNSSVKSKLRRLDKQFRTTLTAGKKDEAVKLLSGVHSAYDKAVKAGAITRPTANRKKSRLALALKK
jgi:small subunit ribosomal protein S20